jgi:large subunit ribosomal protein L21
MKTKKTAPAATTPIKEDTIATFDRYAIIQTGGKQYQAIEGKTLAIEKVDGEVGAKVTFDQVLLRKENADTIEIGKPFLKKSVVASIVKQMKAPKVIVFKFKRRKKSRVKKGHRQPQTIVRIESI